MNKLEKQNCGVACIIRFLEITERYDERLIQMLEKNVTEEGLSFQAVIDVMQEFGYDVKAYYSHMVFRMVPYIMFDNRRKHYYLIEDFSRFTVQLYDPNMGAVRILRLLFRLFWCKYYLVICYNKDT